MILLPLNARGMQERRRGREVEGTPLLREHVGQNLHQGFESLRLRQVFSGKTPMHSDELELFRC